MKTGQQQLTFLNILLGVLCLGILAGSGVNFSPVLLGGFVGFFLLLSMVLLYRSSTRAQYAFVLLFAALGAWCGLLASALPASDISHWQGQDGILCGTVLEEPRRLEDAEGGSRIRYVVAAETLQQADREQRVTGSVFLSIRLQPGHPEPVVHIGDQVRAAGTIRRLHGYQNPGRMDTVQAARIRGITAQLSAGRSGLEVEPQERMIFLRKMAQIRAYYRSMMQRVMPEQDAAAVFAMLFGGYDGIRPELLEAFTTTGIVHILSVSGSHITLLAATMAWLGSLLRLRKGVTVFLVTLSIAAYSVLAGCVPPVIRSGIMGLLTFMALAMEREKDARRILTLTAMLMLLVSPLLLFDISFQLSFAATAGLLYLSPVLRQWMRRWPSAVSGSLAITLGAQLAVLPLLAWYFHMVSVSSLLANLVAVPVVEMMIVLGLLAGFVGILVPPLAYLVYAVDSLMLGVVYALTRGLAALPASRIYLPPLCPVVSLLYYLGLCLLLLPDQRRAVYRWCQGYRWPLLGVLLVAGVVLGLYNWLRPSEMAVHFLDVGQGDAVLVCTPHGHAFMIDTGGTRENAFDIGGRVDVPYLLQYSVYHLDYIFLTHAHEDHAAGTGGILHQLPVDHILTGSEGKAEYARSMGLSMASPELRNMVPVSEGMHIELDGVSIDILYAPAMPKQGSRTGNEVSNVIRVSYGNASFLFTGDLIKEQENILLQEHKNLCSTVLKVGHHGSDTSSSSAFLSAVQPRWAVISVGADNHFGHPSPTIVQRLAASGAEIRRTDEDGALVFRTDGNRMWVEGYCE